MTGVRDQPISHLLSDIRTVAPDLFDVPHVPEEEATGALSPMSRRLHWKFALAAGVFGLVISLLFRWTVPSIALTTLVFGAAYLPALPLAARRVRAVLLGAYLFAGVTTIFVTPFTWPMRFIFATVLLATPSFFMPRAD